VNCVTVRRTHLKCLAGFRTQTTQTRMRDIRRCCDKCASQDVKMLCGPIVIGVQKRNVLSFRRCNPRVSRGWKSSISLIPLPMNGLRNHSLESLDKFLRSVVRSILSHNQFPIRKYLGFYRLEGSRNICLCSKSRNTYANGWVCHGRTYNWYGC
jgi:hypothetical protein